MKKVTNARLYDVRMTLDIKDEPTLVLEGSLEYASEGGKGEFCFSFSELVLTDNSEKLMHLMKYAQVAEIGDLNGAIVRVVLDETNNIYAFGDLMENSFFEYETGFAIVTEEEFMKE